METIKRGFKKFVVILVWLVFAVVTLYLDPWLYDHMGWWAVAPLFSLCAVVGLISASTWPPKKPKAVSHK